jgi:short subunit dehydrogenase-like uncharacterized protein
MKPWLLYGANGYTGRLIAKEAVARGMRPVLAGRDRETVEQLARELGLESRVFDLRDGDELSRQLEGHALVLNCAGPFSRTCEPLLETCLRMRVHYLDITGEIDVFAHCHHQHARAADSGIVVFPGTGFDVVPTDCLAALLKQRMPDAESLVLAFDAGGGASPGTAKTSVEGLVNGGRARINGEVRAVPLAWKTREFTREDGVQRSTVTIPWGDVYTAYVSTSIPNIETYMAMPAKTIANLRRLRWLRPMLRWSPIRDYLQARAGQTRGPDEDRRARSSSYVWGEVRNARGEATRLALHTPNGYSLTVDASLGIVSHALTTNPTGGYYTPSLLMGADYILRLRDCRLIE